jgi:hypothetical protein
MTEPSRERNLDFGLFLLAFGLALALRLLRLGEIPLADVEARWALQAFDLTRGLRPEIGSQPGYVILTALAFFLFQASNFVARLVPALFGAILTVTPFYFRDWLGRKPALALAFFLALDPGWLGLSRLAGTPVIPVTAALLALGLWRAGNPRAAGIWTGVALLGGPQLWPGALAVAVASALFRGMVSGGAASDQPAPLDRSPWVTLALSAAGTYLLLGSFFLLATGGLSAGLAALPEYLSGWLASGDVPVWRLLLGLAAYELFPVLLALAGLVRGLLKRDPQVIFLGLWLLSTLILTLAYPSRQVADLAWVLIPLLALAALEISNYLLPAQDGLWETVGMAAFTGAILIFAALNYTSIALVAADPQAWMLRWGILLGSMLLLGLSIVMVGFGWSVPVAAQGSLWGALLILVAYQFSTAMAAGNLRTYRTTELWLAGPYTNQASALVSQMNDLSRWKTGSNQALDVTLLGVDSPALRWVLRDWPVTVSSGLTGAETPAILIASDQFSKPEIESQYRGQDLIWRSYPAWNQALPADWLRWSLRHEFPSGDEKFILWVRSDIFVDSQNNP